MRKPSLIWVAVILSIVISLALPGEAHAADAALSSLTVSGATFTPPFSADTLSYVAVVHYTTRSVTVTAVAGTTGAGIKINGAVVTNGNPSRPIALGGNDTPISIVVTAPDLKSTRTYTVTLRKGASANSELSSLSIAGTPLVPNFNRAITSYTAAAPNTATSVAVSAVPFDSGSTVTVNGTTTKGGGSVLVPLEPGRNALDVVVNSQDGGNSTTYSVIVSRARSKNAAAAFLSLSEGVLSPGFDPEVLAYSAAVSPGTSSIAVAASAKEGGSVRVNGDLLLAGHPTSQVDLVTGDSQITVDVLAPDAQTSRVYSITVTRPAPLEHQSTVTGGAVTTTDRETGSRLMFVTVDPDCIERVISSPDTPPVARILGTESSVVAQFGGESFYRLRESKAVIRVATPLAQVDISPSVVDLEDVQILLTTPMPGPKPPPIPAKDLRFNVAIKDPPPAAQASLITAAAKIGATVVRRPASFVVQAITGDRIAEITSFSGFIDHYIWLGAADTTSLAGVVLNKDGSLSPVPISLVTSSGQAMIRLRTMTNETYALVKLTATYADTNAHWAKDAILDMAARLVIPPPTGAPSSVTAFRPDEAVTRGEFASLTVRALGLTRGGAGRNVFSDVRVGDPYYDAVYAAYKVGIVQGQDGAKFSPGAKITREEAFTMIYRAIKAVSTPDESSLSALDSYEDAADVSPWAREATAACIQAKIVNGSLGRLAPKTNVTRAQTVVMLRRVLETQGLI